MVAVDEKGMVVDCAVEDGDDIVAVVDDVVVVSVVVAVGDLAVGVWLCGWGGGEVGRERPGGDGAGLRPLLMNCENVQSGEEREGEREGERERERGRKGGRKRGRCREEERERGREGRQSTWKVTLIW